MSRYEWEEGKVVLPSAEYQRVRVAVVTAFNAHQDELYARAQKAFTAAKALAKGRSKTPAVYRLVERLASEIGMSCRVYPVLYPAVSGGWDYDLSGGDEDRGLIWDKMVTSERVGGVKTVRVTAPKRKDFAHVRLTGPVVLVPVGHEATIVFTTATRTARWRVEEGNHAVSEVRKRPVARAFFTALDKVKWTRGSGGYFIGNDECNRDEGDGANYITRTWGPEGEKARKDAEKGAGFRRRRD